MTRSSYKLPYTAVNTDSIVHDKDYYRVTSSTSKKVKVDVNEGYLVYQRGSTIVPEMIGRTVKIHEGHKFVKLLVTEHTVGYKYGEFAPTKKRAIYKKKKKR